MANKLFRELVGLTGLPTDMIQDELIGMLDKKGINPDELTMESLRLALADYLTHVSEEMAAGEMAGLEDVAIASETESSSVFPKWKEPSQ